MHTFETALIQQKSNNVPLNLVTSSYVPFDQESSPMTTGQNPNGTNYFAENRLVISKNVLIKTFNRFLNNPKSFLLQPASYQDLIDLNRQFDDVRLASRLFRTGKENLRGSIE